MDPEQSHVSIKNDNNHKSVLPSSSTDEKSFASPVEAANSNSDGKDSEIVDRIQEIALDSSRSAKTEWTTSTASIHLTASVRNKTGGMFEEEEEGELDYEEDEGEIPGAQEDKNGLKNDIDDDKEEGEVEDDEQEEEGEEGEILSDEDDKVNTESKTQEQHNSAKDETDGPEEGEVIEDGDSTGAPVLRTKVCRYFTYGGCTWGNSCRFLHPGHNDKGAYQMLPEPGQYPSPFLKVPAVVPPVHPEDMMASFPDQDLRQMGDEMSDNGVKPVPEAVAPPKKETAWERGLKLAKEIKKAAQKRKEEDADFEEKRMILGITADVDEDENDKENLMRRRELMRSRLEKDAMYGEEEDARYRRGGDVVSRWRDKKEVSPLQYRDRDRRKKRVHRSPSSSPERDRRSRRKAGDKDKQKEKSKETVKERDTERTKKAAKESEKTGEEKVKKKKDKGKAKEEEGKNDSEDKQQATPAVTEQQENTIEEKKNKDEAKKKRTQEISVDAEAKTTKDTEKKEDLKESGVDDKDKPKPKALGISSSRLPNDDWIDPWQRTTSPKRQSASSRSSRSRSSSSSSDSSRSSRSHSHSGSESRSTSRSASRSRSHSVSPTSSRSRSRSRSGSRSKSRSRSVSRSSGSDRSSSSSSNSPMKEAKTAPNEADDDRGAKQASHESSDSESESNKSKSPSPTPVQKSPAKPKVSPDKGPRTPPVESTSSRHVKEKKNRDEYSRADRIEKWRQGQLRHDPPWDPRRMGGTRPAEDPYRGRERGYHSRRGRSPGRRRRSRSPRRRNEERRRADESKTRERSSSADSMEHALARPSSPRATRERGGLRRMSSASSSDSASSDSGSESEDEHNPTRTRRAAPEQVKQARNVPLTSGNIRYTGHKDIKLTLNKSVARKDNTESSKPPAPHSPPSRSEASSSNDKPSALKKRPRDSSPVPDAPVAVKEAVESCETVHSSNKSEKRSADSQVEAAAPSGRGNAANTSSRREELLRELKAVEDAIARKRARIE